MKRWWPALVAIAVIVASIAALVAVFLHFQDRAYQSYLAGRVAYERLDAATAIARYEEVIKYPKLMGEFVEDAHLKLAEVQSYKSAQALWDNGDYAEASTALAAIVEQYPMSPFAGQSGKLLAEFQAYRDADQQWKNAEYEGAVKAFETFVESYPESPFYSQSIQALQDIPFEWAGKFVNENDFPAAIDLYDQVVSDASMPEERISQAVSLRDATFIVWAEYETAQKNFSVAEEIYLKLSQESGVAVEPALAQLYIDWGTHLRDSEDHAGAIDQFMKVANLKASGSDVREQAQGLISSTYLEWGDQLREAGEYAEAVEKYSSVIELESKNTASQVQVKTLLNNTYLEWADHHYQQGDKEKAGEVYSQMIKVAGPDAYSLLPPQAMEALVLYGQSLLRQEFFSSAQTVFESALKLIQEDDILLAAGYSGLGEAFNGQKRFLDAIRNYYLALNFANNSQEREAIEAAIQDAIAGISQLGVNDRTAKALVGILSKMVVETGRLDLAKQQCDGVCFSPEELQAGQRAIGFDENAYGFFVYEGLPKYVPPKMLATNLGNLKYVTAIVDEEVKVQTCPYSYLGIGTATHFLIRIKNTTTITVYDLVRGRKIATKTITGSNPDPCPRSRVFKSTTEYQKGSEPSIEEIEAYFLTYYKAPTLSTRFRNVYFSENFNNNSNEWPVGKIEGSYWVGTRSIEGGVLQFAGTSQRGFWSLFTPDKSSLQDYVSDAQVSVKQKASSQTEASYFGLAVRVTEDNFYAFIIDNAQNSFAFLLWKNQEWAELVKWKESSSLKRTDWNVLSVQAEGNRFQLFINDQLVADIKNDTITAGQNGVIVGCWERGKKFQIQFDTYEVKVP